MTDEFPDKTAIYRLRLSPEAAGSRLDQALASALPQFSRSRLQSWIESGLVRVDGRQPKPRDKVLGGEQVVLEARFAASTRVAPEERPVDVVYSDSHLLIVNKPAGLVVHPGAGNAHGTLQNALLALDPELALVPRAGIVHRLDKDTSGLLLVARTPEVHVALVDLLAERAIKREYLALAQGALTGGGTVAAAIGRHRSDRLKMSVRSDGREAITHYRIEKRFPVHTLLRVTLQTGRTHQIRVHLAHIGYPIVGDPVYGGRRRLPAGASPQLLAALAGFRRQALHAALLALQHPVTGKALRAEVPLPADFTSLLAVLASIAT